MIFKFKKNKKNGGQQKGMSYVELIVVLSIFSIVTGTVIFNYKSFQAKVDLRNLANDIALKFVEAQKNSTSGKLPLGKIILNSPPLPAPWKPSYGIYFNGAPGANTGSQVFYYFTDLNQDKSFDNSYDCQIGECIERFNLTKENYLADMAIFKHDGDVISVDTGLSLTFTRPDSVVTMRRSNDVEPLEGVNYLEFQIQEANASVLIRIYASGRIEMM